MQPLALLVVALAASPPTGTALGRQGPATSLIHVEEAKLTAAVRDQSGLGYSVGIDGDTAVLGAPKNAGGGTAHVFARTPGGWAEQAELVGAAVKISDWFGAAVAVSGDTVLVGSIQADFQGDGSGAVYVFTRQGTTWTEEPLLLPADGAAGDQFGLAVAIDGDTAVVGAPGDDDMGSWSGSVYVFERAGTTWTETAKLTAADGAQDGHLGAAVALDGDRIAAGAWGAAPSGVFSGAAYVFARVGTAWTQETRLTALDGAVSDHLGWSVAISGDRVLAGAPYDDDGGNSTGSAYVFTRAGPAWVQEAKLTAAPPVGSFDQFGLSVGLARDTAVVGALRGDGNYPDTGAAHVFRASGGQWSELGELTASDGFPDDKFGWSTAVSGDTVLVGSVDDDQTGFHAGAGYVYRLLPEPSVHCAAKPTSCGTLPAIGYLGTPRASLASGFVVRADGAKANKAGLLLYTDAGPGNAPFQGGTLCLDTGSIRRSIAVTDSAGAPGQCDGVLAIDLNAFAAGALGGNPSASLGTPGTRVDCQFWGRDTLQNGALLSDALAYFVGT